MDWSEERYVRLYTRDTAEWMSWPWQARALFPLLIRKADRTGAIALGKLGRKGLALLVGLPLNVVEPDLDTLVADGCVQEHPGYVIMPNFLEAQECRSHWHEARSTRREREKAAVGFATADQVAARVSFFGSVCVYCGAPWEHIDHVIPIARGGSKWPANLRPACGRCNRSKGSKRLVEWKGASA